MKKDILVKIIITVLVFILLGCFVYTNYISKEKDLVFEARIKEVYYILDNEKEINNNVKITKINSEKNEYFQEELKGFFKNKR